MDRGKWEKLVFGLFVIVCVIGVLYIANRTMAKRRGDMQTYKEKASQAQQYLEDMEKEK